MFRSFDIETYNDQGVLIPYCIAYKSTETRCFYGQSCVSDFLNFVENEACLLRYKKKKHIFYLFSHNLTFDGSIIIQNLNLVKGESINGLFFKGNIYFFEIKTKLGITIRFKCSYRFFPTKLENASLFLDVFEKKKFDHSIVSKNNIFELKAIAEEYCTNDSEIVSQIVKKYNNIFNIFEPEWFSKTHSLPGLAVYIFLNKYNSYNVEFHLTLEQDCMFRSSYFGGRCEIFGNPTSDELIYHFDFVGMYAQVMLESYNYGSFHINENVVEFKKNGFYYIDAYSNMEIPVLPHHSADGKLLFTNGTFSGLYWWEEIELFCKMGGEILKFKYHIEFENNDLIFKDFVEDFTKLRSKNKACNTICKYLINSLYGRLGMGEISSETKLMSYTDYLMWQEKNESRILKENWINELVFVEYRKKRFSESINSNVYLAAMVTAKARIKLYRGFVDVIKNGGRLLYCDTDSIFASFKKNVDNERFGEVFFDITKKNTKIKKAVFALPKAYAIELWDGTTEIKIKGAKTLLTFDEFKKIFKNENSHNIRISILKKSNFVISEKEIDKLINLSNYNKRIFFNSKKYTRSLWKKDNLYIDSAEFINEEVSIIKK